MPNSHKETSVLRGKNSKTPSKDGLKSNAKKVLKNRSGKPVPKQNEDSEGNDRQGKVVIWKSSRGRTEQKQWSYEQEQLLFALHDQLGNRWTIISQKFSSKTDNDIKNHLFSRFRLAVRRINKIAQNLVTPMRPLKMTIISKIMAVCDSRFSNVSLPSSSFLNTAQRLKRDLLTFLYENPINSSSIKTEKLIKELHAFGESFIRRGRNIQRDKFSEGQDQLDFEGSNSQHHEQPLMDFQNEGESQPTRLQENLMEQNANQRYSAFVNEGLSFEPLLPDISINAVDSTILSPECTPHIFVGDCLSVHCADSLLPPIRTDDTYQYDMIKDEIDLFEYLAFSN